MSVATAPAPPPPPPPPPPSIPDVAEPVPGRRDAAAVAAPPDFSMVLGGPLYQLFLRMRIVRQPLDLLTRRVVVISLLAWLPLLVLSVTGGRAWGGAQVPFLYDIAAH